MKKKVLSLILVGAACVTLAACGGAGSTEQTTTATTTTSVEFTPMDVSETIYDSEYATIDFYGIVDNDDVNALLEENTLDEENGIHLLFRIQNKYTNSDEIRVFCQEMIVDSEIVSTKGVMQIHKGDVGDGYLTIPYKDLSVKDKKDITAIAFELEISDGKGYHIDSTDYKIYEFQDGILVNHYDYTP